MSFIEDLQSKDTKGLFTSNDKFINYSTSLLPLDYANAFVANIWDPVAGKPMRKAITGVIGGTFTTVIGTSGSGKTTLAQQMGASIIRPFKEGLLIHVDIEKTALRQRLVDITAFDYSDPRLILQKEQTSIEDVMELMDAIAETKDKAGKAMQYEVTDLSYDGKPFRVYIPTVIILDSLYVFNSKERKNMELDGQMTAGREAREIAQFFTKSLDIMLKYNINVICVNHIKTKIQINMYEKPKQQLMMLAPSESLPKGDNPIYLSQNVFRCNSIKSNMYTMKDDGFEGVKVTIQIAKSKTTFVGSGIDVAFNKDYGFDPIFSLYEFAHGAKLIDGRNPYMYFVGMEAVKFNRKDFRRRFIEEDEFRWMVMEAIDPLLKSLVGSKLNPEEEDGLSKKYYDINTLNLARSNNEITKPKSKIIVKSA